MIEGNTEVSPPRRWGWLLIYFPKLPPPPPQVPRFPAMHNSTSQTHSCDNLPYCSLFSHPHLTVNPCFSPMIQLKMISSKFRWVVHLKECDRGGKPWGLFVMFYFLSRRFMPLFYMALYVWSISSQYIFKTDSVQATPPPWSPPLATFPCQESSSEIHYGRSEATLCF